MKQPFLYLDTAEISAEDIASLSDSGFIPIKVKSFGDVKILDTLGANNSDFIVSMVDALNEKGHNAENVRGVFAKNLFKRLADSQEPTQ